MRQLRCDGRLQPTQQQIKPALQGVGGVGVGQRGSRDAKEDCDSDEVGNNVDYDGSDGPQARYSSWRWRCRSEVVRLHALLSC